MRFLKRLARWTITKSSGHQTAGAGAVGIPLVMLLAALGIPMPMELAAAIPAVLSTLTAIGKDE